MLSKKHIKKLTAKMVKASFDDRNNLQNKKVKDFVSLMKKFDNMESLLMLTSYAKGLKNQMSKSTLDVSSAVPLSTVTKKKIENLIKKDYKITSSNFEVDKSLLGGLKIKIADEIINASLRGKIEELKSYAK